MKTPKRIQLSRKRGWKMPPNTVKIDRSTPWGNPFVVGWHGTQQECVDLYIHLLSGRLCVSMDNIAQQRKARAYVAGLAHLLRGKNLACWCRIGTPCHGDVLLRFAEMKTNVVEVTRR